MRDHVTAKPTGVHRVVTPPRVVAVAVGYVIAAWAAVYAVDVAGLGAEPSVPLWINLFHESYVTEMLQWAALGAAALVAGRLGGTLRASEDHRLGSFWTLMSVALVLMLIEDAGNPRHALGNFGETLFGVPGFVTNMAILAAVAVVPVYALLRHWRAVWAQRPSRWYVLAAFATYGLAGALSGSGPLWYHRAGARLNDALFAGRLPEPQIIEADHGFLIMDLLVEESVELIGAALFLAASLAVVRHRASSRDAG